MPSMPFLHACVEVPMIKLDERARLALRREEANALPVELEDAERKIELYEPWRRVLRLVDAVLEASGPRDACEDRVRGGELPVPQAQRVLERREAHPEYRRILRNVEAVEAAFSALTDLERAFAVQYWIESSCSWNRAETMALEMECDVRTVFRWRGKCLKKMLPFLDRADTTLVRAAWVEEWVSESDGSEHKKAQGGAA